MASYPFYRASAAQAQALGRVPNLPNANIGLWFTRFYDGFEAPDWKIKPESKRGFIDATVQLADKQGTTGKACLELMAKRQKNLCEALGGVCRTLRTSAPLLTGSGLSHPVENGFTFHPTLGVPYLPASGVKGVLRAWVEVWSDLSEDERQRRIAHWFGAAKGTEGLPENQPEQAGALIFFDALPLDWMRLRCDILTPHMGKWYEQGGEIGSSNFAEVAPGDWYSPVPSPFLVVDRGASFLFGIAPRCTGDAQQDALACEAAGEAMETLLLALEWAGYGAKTAAGYGVMQRDGAREQKLNEACAEDRRQLAEKEQQQQREIAKTHMSPADRAMADLFDQRADKNQDERTVLFSALKAGKLNEHRIQAAERLCALMQQQKRWREKSEKKNPDKDSLYQDTLLVKKWLAP